MYPNFISKTIVLSDGREISIETGKLAKQSDGSVVVKMGKTMLLATVVCNKEAKEGSDFLPLSVDYQERFSAAGKIPGGFLRREGKLSDHEVLISRLVDRAIRPLFPDDFHADIQVNIYLISSDPDVIPDALAGLAASAALIISNIPFLGPISEVRVAKIDGKYIINPNRIELKNATLDFMVAASLENILMVEGEAKEISEKEMLESIQIAHEEIKKHCIAQKELESLLNKSIKREYCHEQKDETILQDIQNKLYTKCYEVARKNITNKNERAESFANIKKEYLESFHEEREINEGLVSKYFHKVEKEAIRNYVLANRKRIDGRNLDEIRSIWSEIDYLPAAHGSSIFTRGETQSLTTVTLGTKLDEQMIDGATISGYSKLMLHYNFPGFSTGEVKPNRSPGRREIGHGNLALRALKAVIPSDEENPYTIRIVSDILESNGSSSMATVCAATLALMDAGVSIKAPVAGIAMGMISDANTKKYAILSDILGDEDHLGDMDFKVTGTKNGITACQMDLKVEGLTYQVLEEALEQAKRGRLFILDKIEQTISKPRPDLKPHAPRSTKIFIEKNQIGAVIGPGGKVVQEIQKSTGATVVIEEGETHGIVNIYSVNQDIMDRAVSRVKSIVTLPTVGDVYDGKVKNIQSFGAFVEFLPGKEGLLHISEITWERLENVDSVLTIGEEIKVKLIEIDKKTGKYKLSKKILSQKK